MIWRKSSWNCTLNLKELRLKKIKLAKRKDETPVQNTLTAVFSFNSMIWPKRETREKDHRFAITRQESRSYVHHALDTLQSEFTEIFKGQPGIGNTRMSMMCAT